MFKPEVINQAYLALKETLGNSQLGCSKNLVLAVINLHEKTYYLIQNLTNKNFELTFEDNKVITLTSKVFISSIKPINAKELLIVPQDEIQHLSTFDSVVQNKQKISKKDYSFVVLNQKVLDDNFKDNSFLNKNLKFPTYIFSTEFPKELQSKVDIEEFTDSLKIHLHPDKTYVLKNTILVDGMFYTNNVLRVNQAIERLHKLIPTQKNKELAYIRSNMYYSVRELSDLCLQLPLNSLPDQDKFKQLLNELREILK